MLVYRHKLPIRIMHWINILCFTVLFMSGLNIFNSHAALNLGKSSYNGYAPILEMKSTQKSNGALISITNIFGCEFNTAGVLGASTDPGGNFD